LTVRGGSLSVTTGDGSKCTAIRALSSFDFPSGTITAASGSSAANPLDSGSYGLYICGESRIGGQLTATGGDAPTRSHTYPMSAGIYTVGSLEITGSVRATSSTGYDAYGMYIVGDLTIGKTGSLTAKNGSRTPTNTASGIRMYRGNLTLNGGTVRAESGAAVQLSAGVFFDTVTITINSGRFTVLRGGDCSGSGLFGHRNTLIVNGGSFTADDAYLLRLQVSGGKASFGGSSPRPGAALNVAELRVTGGQLSALGDEYGIFSDSKLDISGYKNSKVQLEGGTVIAKGSICAICVRDPRAESRIFEVSGNLRCGSSSSSCRKEAAVGMDNILGGDYLFPCIVEKESGEMAKYVKIT
ncbi:MAG: hypothetical protein PUC47_11835, partial [Oscillospiraceae bacterium]|nr:hypothetical protein [Oscillospiraceae bacterium]